VPRRETTEELIARLERAIEDDYARVRTTVREAADDQAVRNAAHDLDHRATWAWDHAGPVVSESLARIERNANKLARAYLTR
jgi:hypothetical protein